MAVPQKSNGAGRAGREEFSPGTSLSYWGMPFLGHGRMGHLPDYPFMRICTRPSGRDSRFKTIRATI